MLQALEQQAQLKDGTLIPLSLSISVTVHFLFLEEAFPVPLFIDFLSLS